MKRKQIILAALLICFTGVCCFAQSFKLEINGLFNKKKGKADLTIREIKFEGKSGNRLNVAVENKGNSTSEVSRLLLTVEGINKSLKFRQNETLVLKIEGGETRWVNIFAPVFLPKGVSLSSTDFILKIDSNEEIAETDETNNEFYYKAENQEDNSIDEQENSVENNSEENSDETKNEESEIDENSTDEPENSDENVGEESESGEVDSIDESEDSVDSGEDGSENSVEDESVEPEDSEEIKNEETVDDKSSTKKEKVKALNNLIDSIQVLIKPSSNPKIKP